MSFVSGYEYWKFLETAEKKYKKSSVYIYQTYRMQLALVKKKRKKQHAYVFV
jgi:hypothetical protein